MSSSTPILSRHYVVEFAGMPKSGKTTILDTVSQYIRRNGVKIRDYHGGGRYAPIDKSDLDLLNLYLACDNIAHLISVGAQGEEPRLHLLDRGIMDRLIFTAALKELGRIDAHAADSLSSVLTLPLLTRRVDLAFVFIASESTCLEREMQRKLGPANGRVMNSDTLGALGRAAREIAESPPGPFPVEVVDTEANDGSVESTAQFVLTRILQLIPEANLLLGPNPDG